MIKRSQSSGGAALLRAARARRALVAICVALLLLPAFPFARVGRAAAPAPFTFVVASDQRSFAGSGYDSASYFRGAVDAIGALGGGAFMVSVGDIDPPAESMWTIEQVLGTDYLWYPVVGNHELPGAGTEPGYGTNMAWLRAYDYDQNGAGNLPDIVNAGPSGCPETTYSFDYQNVHFVVLNEYYDMGGDAVTSGDVPDHLYNWLVGDLQATSQEHVFVFGHEPAYPQRDADNGRLRHQGDSLDQHPANRDRFWNLLKTEAVLAYVVGHTHNYSAYYRDSVWQLDSGHARGAGDTGAPSTFLMIHVDGGTVTFDAYRDTHDGVYDYDDIVHSGELTRATPDTLIPAGDIWRYLDDGSNQGVAWRELGFDDTSWSAGPAQLGYGDGDEATVVSYGADANDKHITTYFRRVFSLADASRFTALTLRVLRDDGAVVYLNGTEVYCTNMPAVPIDHFTGASAAIGGAEESIFHGTSVDSGLLVNGDNVVAVEIHQANNTSSDISFDLDLTGVRESARMPTIGYFPDWAALFAGSIEYDKLTHVNYFSLAPLFDGSLNTGYITPGVLGQVVSDAHAAGVTVSISIGGWERSDGFPGMASSPSARGAFIQNILDFVTQYNLDGVDLDWEPVDTDAKKDNYSTLIEELRSALPQGKLLSVAVNAERLEIRSWAVDDLDWIGIMAYDMNWPNADHSTYADAIAAMTYWEGLPAPRSKLVMGIPFYGRDDGWVNAQTYAWIVDTYGPAPEDDWAGGYFFNGIDTTQAKTAYVYDNDYAGVMIWELSQDKQDYRSLLKAIFDKASEYDTDPPQAPTNLAATAVSTTEIDLSWIDNADNEGGFRIERSPDGGAWALIDSVGAGVISYADVGLAPDTTYYYQVQAYNAAGASAYSNVASATTEPPPQYVDQTATGEQYSFGTVSGSYVDTQANDGTSQTITERQSGGKPSKRHSYLEHTWVFDEQTGIAVTFLANVWAPASSDGDTFVLAYSVDDSTYLDMFTVSATSDDDSYQSFALPAGVSGPVYVRVVDTDRTQGHRELDAVYVDQAFIRTELLPGEPPASPTGLAASAVSASQIDLAWTDNATDETGFEIERSLDGAGNWVLVDTAGFDATAYSDAGLASSTTYHYRVRAYNGSGASGYSNVASATTGQASTIHVGDLDRSSSPGNRNRWDAMVTITVHDEGDGPLAGATVSGSWTAGASGGGLCVTGPSGQCIITKSSLKSRISSATFAVDDVTLTGYAYNPEVNHDPDPDSDGTTIMVLKPG